MDEKSIVQYVGSQIRMYRKSQNYTLEQLAARLHKSKSTLSKYETGEISVDLSVLYQLSEIFSVQIGNFLPPSTQPSNALLSQQFAPLQSKTRLFCYHWDARPHRSGLYVSMLEIEREGSHCVCYWNIIDENNYKRTGYLFHGAILRSETSRRFVLTHTVSPMDMLVINYLDPLVHHNIEVFGNVSSMSVGQFECYTTKCLLSDHPIPHNEELIKRLEINKSVISELRRTNTFRMNYL